MFACVHMYIYIYTYIHYITLHYITLHYITLHYITLHYITLHYITLHYITLHYITLHYIHTYCYGADPSDRQTESETRSRNPHCKRTSSGLTFHDTNQLKRTHSKETTLYPGLSAFQAGPGGPSYILATLLGTGPRFGKAWSNPKPWSAFMCFQFS